MHAAKVLQVCKDSWLLRCGLGTWTRFRASSCPQGAVPLTPMHTVKTIHCNGIEDYLPGANRPAEKREQVMGVRG